MFHPAKAGTSILAFVWNKRSCYRSGESKYSRVKPTANPKLWQEPNSNVPPVYPNDPNANTAHDIIKVNVNDATDVVVITQPGPISIVPDWRGNKILFLEITDKTNPPHVDNSLLIVPPISVMLGRVFR